MPDITFSPSDEFDRILSQRAAENNFGRLGETAEQVNTSFRALLNTVGENTLLETVNRLDVPEYQREVYRNVISDQARRTRSTPIESEEFEPYCVRNGQLSRESLGLLYLLQYIFFSMKPCIRRLNVLWNRRLLADDTRRRMNFRGDVETGSGTNSFINNVRRSFTFFQDSHEHSSESWGRGIYAEHVEVLQSLPATPFNWQVLFGGTMPRELRVPDTDGYDGRDLAMIGESRAFSRHD